jgi:hypothetical protein
LGVSGLRFTARGGDIFVPRRLSKYLRCLQLEHGGFAFFHPLRERFSSLFVPVLFYTLCRARPLDEGAGYSHARRDPGTPGKQPRVSRREVCRDWLGICAIEPGGDGSGHGGKRHCQQRPAQFSRLHVLLVHLDPTFHGIHAGTLFLYRFLVKQSLVVAIVIDDPLFLDGNPVAGKALGRLQFPGDTPV